MYRRSSLYAKANASINCRYNYCTIMFIRFYDSLTLSSTILEFLIKEKKEKRKKRRRDH